MKVVQIVVDGFVNIQLSLTSLYSLQRVNNFVSGDLKGVPCE